MLWKRNVRLSLQGMLTDLLEEPSAAYIAKGMPEYNVYLEDKFRNQAFVPTVPFIFLVDYGIPLVLERLPCVVIEIDSHVLFAYELGNSTRAKGHEVSLHIHGRTRAERDDLVSYLSESLDIITIYDYTDDVDAPTQVEVTEFSDAIGVGDVRVTDDSAAEGTLLNYSLLTFDFATKGI